MVDKIQPYNLPFWLFRDKTLKQTLDLTCELGIVEHNSLTPNSRNCEALESYEHESPETQQYTMMHEMHMKQAWCDQAKMELRNKPWLDQISNQYMVVTTMLIHTWNEHLDIQANKNKAGYLYAQHSTNA